jgi:hypothetical protein
VSEERDYVTEALEQGWKPKDQFNGPEEKFTDAQTFVEKGEKISGILKQRLEKQEQDIANLKNANKEFGEYQKKLREKELSAAQARIAELEAQRAAAVTEGDGQAFTKLDRDIQLERDNMVQQQSAPQNEVQIEQAWASNNQWYGRDPALTAFADGVSGMVEAEGFQGQARLDEIARRTKATFPDKFENPKRKSSNGVESGSQIETDNSKAKTYENLPPDAKAACDRFESNGLMSKEDYVKSFEWE